MRAGIFLLGLIIFVIGLIYLAPMVGFALPISLPNFGINNLYLGGGLALFGIILLIAGAKMI